MATYRGVNRWNTVNTGHSQIVSTASTRCTESGRATRMMSARSEREQAQ